MYDYFHVNIRTTYIVVIFLIYWMPLVGSIQEPEITTWFLHGLLGY